MSDAEADIPLLIDAELARVADLARRGTLQGLLHQPLRLSLAWEYGRADERFECWQVGRAPDGHLLLVYCERGFGPAFPWGFVSANELSMGMDSQWHARLEDVATSAGLLPTPAGYEVPGPRPSGGVG